jgi:hypothetical protein
MHAYTSVAPTFRAVAWADGFVVALENDDRKIYGVQFHPEVDLSEDVSTCVCVCVYTWRQEDPQRPVSPWLDPDVGVCILCVCVSISMYVWICVYTWKDSNPWRSAAPRSCLVLPDVVCACLCVSVRSIVLCVYVCMYMMLQSTLLNKDVSWISRGCVQWRSHTHTKMYIYTHAHTMVCWHACIYLCKHMHTYTHSHI